MNPPCEVLIVEDDPERLAWLVGLLSHAGYAATGVGTFEEARRRLATSSFDLLIAEVRLGAFNGFHLLLHGRRYHPGLAAVMISASPDRVLEADAAGRGARCLSGPLEAPRLVAVAGEAIAAAKELLGEPRG